MTQKQETTKIKIPFGIQIIVAAFIFAGGALMVGMTIFADLPQFKDDVRVNAVLAAILCNRDEQLIREQKLHPSTSRGAHQLTAYCVNASGTHDVTLNEFVIGTGGFGLFLFIGIAILIVTYYIKTPLKLKPIVPAAEVPVASKATLPLADVEADLGDQLRQLEERYKAGLVTPEQYEQMRQDILKKIF